MSSANLLAKLSALADQALAESQKVSIDAVPRDFEVPVLHQLLVTAGSAWASADKEATLLEETKRALYAALLLDQLEAARVAGTKLSKADAELMITCDTRYLHHISAMVLARKQANLYRIRYDSTKQLIDMLRTQEANHRSAAGNFA
jgi:hypothetical protein